MLPEWLWIYSHNGESPIHVIWRLIFFVNLLTLCGEMVIFHQTFRFNFGKKSGSKVITPTLLNLCGEEIASNPDLHQLGRPHTSFGKCCYGKPPPSHFFGCAHHNRQHSTSTSPCKEFSQVTTRNAQIQRSKEQTSANCVREVYVENPKKNGWMLELGKQTCKSRCYTHK